MITFTDGPAAGVILSLGRVPRLMRVTFNTITRQWDALDQLDDEPTKFEQIHVYRRITETPTLFHFDYRGKDGRRKGEWSYSAEYQHFGVQPDHATARDTAAWRAWCTAHGPKEVARQEAGGSTPKPGGTA